MIKKIIGILIAMLLVFGVSACKDITIQKEVESILNDKVTSIDIEELINKEEVVENIKYDKVSAYMEGECRKAFSPHYELLGFQISDFHQKVENGNVEAVFSYKLIYKNYDKDPDTVKYIKEAKERGNKNYQQMYDEYLQPREMNFHLKAIFSENDSITLYSNISPKGIEWVETKMTDFIIK